MHRQYALQDKEEEQRNLDKTATGKNGMTGFYSKLLNRDFDQAKPTQASLPPPQEASPKVEAKPEIKDERPARREEVRHHPPKKEYRRRSRSRSPRKERDYKSERQTKHEPPKQPSLEDERNKQYLAQITKASKLAQLKQRFAERKKA